MTGDEFPEKFPKMLENISQPSIETENKARQEMQNVVNSMKIINWLKNIELKKLKSLMSNEQKSKCVCLFVFVGLQ